MTAPPTLALPESWQLPDRMRIRVGRNFSGRQRAICEEDHLLVILHRTPDPHEIERQTRFFWRRPDGEWRCSEDGEAITQLQRHLDEYEEAEEQLAARYAVASCASDYFAILEEVVPLQRSARNMYSALQTARDAVSDDRDLIDFRNQAGDIDRAMELLLQDAKNALDFDVARTAEAQARFSAQSAQAGHRLNILASLFFPLTALASIFGMNLPTGLESAPAWVSWLVMGAGILSGYLVLVWVNRGLKPERPPQLQPPSLPQRQQLFEDPLEEAIGEPEDEKPLATRLPTDTV